MALMEFIADYVWKIVDFFGDMFDVVTLNYHDSKHCLLFILQAKLVYYL